VTRENLLKNLLMKNEGGKLQQFASFATLQQIFEQKKIIWAIFRQAIEGSNLLKNLPSFLPTGLKVTNERRYDT
jgi:hypothetical protein